jgi:hypothetical protein
MQQLDSLALFSRERLRTGGSVFNNSQVGNASFVMGRPSSRRQRSSRDSRSSRRPQPSAGSSPAAVPAPALADRYYAMAEEMNSRGAMELAVPFYRQALALLLAEREQLRAQLPQGAEARPQALPLDQLHGLLEATQSWDQQGAPLSGSDASPSPEQTELPPADPVDLEPTLQELAEDLSAASAEQVLAALAELEGQHGCLPANGLALRGKARMLLGQAGEAAAAFAEACAAEPDRVDLQINRGAALVAAGEIGAALEALRQLYQQHYEHLEGAEKTALLRNLATAEARGGELAVALHLRRQWLQLDPDSQPSGRWLQWAQQGLDDAQPEPTRQAALQLLQRLHALRPGERPVMELLAQALEAQGQFREASLLYRSLLRPVAA